MISNVVEKVELTAWDLCRAFLERSEMNTEKALNLALTEPIPPAILKEVIQYGWSQMLLATARNHRITTLSALQKEPSVFSPRSTKSNSRDSKPFSAAMTRISPVAERRAAVLASKGQLETFSYQGRIIGLEKPDGLREMISVAKLTKETYSRWERFLTEVLAGCKPGKRPIDCFNETDYCDLRRKYQL